MLDRAPVLQWAEPPNPDILWLAVDLARKSIAASPASAGPRLTLARALAGLGAFPEAEAACRAALMTTTASAELHLELAVALRNQDKIEPALEQADAALALAPRDRRALHARLELVALASDPRAGAISDAGAATHGARSLERQVVSLEPEQALALCDRLLAAAPGHTAARRLKARSLARLKRDREAAACMALDRLVQVGDLAPPAGFDARGFHDALAREIMANPTLAPDPRGKATRGGMQTRQLRQPGAVAVDALLDRIRRAIDAYVARLGASDDPFVRGCPKSARIEAWAVVYGAEGRQNAHWHPEGWLSGVYYVVAPRAGEAAHSGALVMGAVKPKELAGPPPWPVWDIQPVPGRLVLFPSYAPHATRPSGVDGARISVAFDVVPVREDDPDDECV